MNSSPKLEFECRLVSGRYNGATYRLRKERSKARAGFAIRERRREQKKNGTFRAFAPLHLVVITFPIRQVALHMHDTTQPRTNHQMIKGISSELQSQSDLESQMYLGMIIIIRE